MESNRIVHSLFNAIRSQLTKSFIIRWHLPYPFLTSYIYVSSIEVREALLNPLRFPDLSPLILKILELLNRFEKWAVFHVSAHMNRIAKSIAESAILGPRPQSYVAAGGPCWLHKMLEEDANSI